VHSGALSVTQATPEDKTWTRLRTGGPGPGDPGRGPTRCNQWMSTPTSRDYGLAPQLRARLMGAFLAAIGVSLLVVTVVVVAFSLPGDVLSGLVILVVIGIFTLGFLLGRRWYVVRLDEVGYQVRFVRGVGAASGRWSEVEDLATSFVANDECVVIRLRNGRSTTIPVNLIEGDREEFVDELKARLRGGTGSRKA
jgi:hypothetical protein